MLNERRIGLVLALLLWVPGILPAAEPTASGLMPTDWPQWRGPNRDGRVATTDAWPVTLDPAALKSVWRVKLGPSYSGPIVVGSRVFTTETQNAKTEHVKAYDRATGKLIWEQKWDGAISVPFFAKSNGDWIRCTPACDGETLFVGGIRDVLVALDVTTGAIRWRADLVKEFNAAVPTFGFVSSPLLTADAVYVQAGAGFVKLDKQTGKVLWRSLNDGGGMNGSAFSSPYRTTIAGRELLLVQGREKLAAVAPDSGKVLWSTEIEAFRGMNILTPIVRGEQIFTSSYGGGSFLLTVGASDSTANGPASAADSLPAPQQLWRNKVQGYMSTPILHDDHIYIHLRNQRFACLDLKTGKETWTTTPFGKYWSLVAQGDRLLALDETGLLRLIRATPEKFDLLSERQLEDNSWAHLAVSGQDVIIRDIGGLTLYRWTTPTPAPSTAARSAATR